MKPDLAAVLDILDHGQIPVVRLHMDSLSLEVRALDPEDNKADYIAFSHVWADGLGSTTEVGLPSCQVQRLHQLANTRTGDGAFWIDALCVPKQQVQREKAIRLMIQTYKHATGVILLDHGLRSLSTSRSDLEVGWSVVASGWFGRLWTYQEGHLAQWVDVDLGDGMIDLYSLVQRLYRRYYDRPEGNPFPSVFVHELLAMLQKARPLDSLNNQRPRSRRLVDLFNALTRRQTSRPTDQFLVIGLLLDLDISQGATLEGEERWKDLYLRIEKIPWTVVFDQRPKMATSLFTWAPSTWISAGSDRWLHYNDEEADITDEGLIVTLKILVLDETATINFTRTVLETEEQHFYELAWEEREVGANSQLVKFDTLFVRYLKGEDPEVVLRLLLSDSPEAVQLSIASVPAESVENPHPKMAGSDLWVQNLELVYVNFDPLLRYMATNAFGCIHWLGIITMSGILWAYLSLVAFLVVPATGCVVFFLYGLHLRELLVSESLHGHNFNRLILIAEHLDAAHLTFFYSDSMVLSSLKQCRHEPQHPTAPLPTFFLRILLQLLILG
ncbi:uncharacterized protein J7T54_005805 [Emericellopsis cladophorae]|uniref:Heterokaryon incompatibility domain-containing protein n=1 Tax=Emericellopsis cladophorae TaxID=2686198 RepID=A0A9P9XU04_9HYPO|nr:uncharacterized protein J7T54_005805 [Emericellopsis cladophorae]KAI6777793.1 hypothetical protein J7T54_005805 [Emericellopsis cladophorae]